MVRQQKNFLYGMIFLVVAMCCNIYGAYGAEISARTEAVFTEANQLYEQGKYAEAIQQYEQIVQNDIQSAVVYYNLGNAYFKQGAIGKAIVNFKRARKLSPRDQDIKNNLDFVELLVADRIELPQKPWLMEKIEYLYSLLTVNEHTLVVSVFYCLFFLGLLSILYLRHKKIVLVRGVIVMGMCLALTAGMLACAIYHHQQKEAVVIARSIDVHSGPAEHYGVQFSVHEGTVFTVLKERNGWCEVRLSGDLQGWAQKSSLEII